MLFPDWQMFIYSLDVYYGEKTKTNVGYVYSFKIHRYFIAL